MNIAALQLGFGSEVPDSITLNIYLSGCKNNKNCERWKCQNSHLHGFNHGTPYRTWFKEIKDILGRNLVQGVVFLGGEPCDQNIEEFIDLYSMIVSEHPDILTYLYTGYEYERIPDEYRAIIFNGIYAGPYIENNPEAQGWVEKTTEIAV